MTAAQERIEEIIKRLYSVETSVKDKVTIKTIADPIDTLESISERVTVLVKENDALHSRCDKLGVYKRISESSWY